MFPPPTPPPVYPYVYPNMGVLRCRLSHHLNYCNLFVNKLSHFLFYYCFHIICNYQTTYNVHVLDCQYQYYYQLYQEFEKQEVTTGHRIWIPISKNPDIPKRGRGSSQSSSDFRVQLT